MKRFIALGALALCLLSGTAMADKARNIASDADSQYHAAHLENHLDTTDVYCTVNNLRVRNQINGQKVLVAALEGADPKSLRGMLDELKNRMKSGVVLLATCADGKVNLIAGVTNDLTGKVKAGELVNLVAQQVGGKGGGRADMAQAGGTQPEAVPAALQSVHSWLEERL